MFTSDLHDEYSVRADGSVWGIEAELLAGNVVRLSWTTTPTDVELSASSDHVTIESQQRVCLRANSSMHVHVVVRLLNDSSTACDVDGQSLIDCTVTALDNNVRIIKPHSARTGTVFTTFGCSHASQQTTVYSVRSERGLSTILHCLQWYKLVLRTGFYVNNCGGSLESSQTTLGAVALSAGK